MGWREREEGRGFSLHSLLATLDLERLLSTEANQGHASRRTVVYRNGEMNIIISIGAHAHTYTCISYPGTRCSVQFSHETWVYPSLKED